MIYIKTNIFEFFLIHIQLIFYFYCFVLCEFPIELIPEIDSNEDFTSDHLTNFLYYLFCCQSGVESSSSKPAQGGPGREANRDAILFFKFKKNSFLETRSMMKTSHPREALENLLRKTCVRSDM
jgi:hypothetical protein